MQYSIKYRPAYFAHVVGQEVACRILVNSILMDRVPSAILFSGIRGTGKTTLARLYALALNCENFLTTQDLCGSCPSCLENHNTHPSIFERDAASYTGVDDIRELENIIRQVIIHKYRVMILDECHMLSKQAQSALLKMLEEPPRNTVFLLVTTDPHRMVDTVRSRCLSAPLKGLTPQDIIHNVESILMAEGKKYTPEFVDTLSRIGGGSLRDVQQVLDSMVMAAGDRILDVDLLQNSMGIISTQDYGELADALDSKKLKFFLKEIRRWYAEGRDLRALFIEGIPVLLRDFMIFLSGISEQEALFQTGIRYDSFLRNLRLGFTEVQYLMREWEVTMEFMRDTADPKIVWSMYAAKVCSFE